METIIHTLKARFDAFVWDADLRDLSGLSKLSIRILRLLYVVIRDLLGGELNLRAMSLVYTTLLAVVPLLAVSFSILKAFGVHNQVAPILRDFLAPLGPKGLDLADNVVGFVENIQVGLLGAVGMTLLIYTVISLMHKIEAALNFVWHIEGLRSFGRRVGNFLSVILIGPLLVFSALGITASVMSTTVVQEVLKIDFFGSLMLGTSKLVPYVLVRIAFTFIYVFVPNTRVQFVAAAAGGLVAGILWQTTGWGFAAFIASSARYAAVYSSFAILILLLIWIYLNWLVLLIGAQIAFYVQSPHFLSRKPVRLTLSNRLKERLALSIMYLVGYNHCHDHPPWTLNRLADRLDLPSEPVQGLLALLGDEGYLEQTADDPPGYLPARAIEKMELRGLLASVRRAGESRFVNEERIASPHQVNEVAAQVNAAVLGALATATVRDLIPERAGPEPVEDTRAGQGATSG
jgi:membrane protein